MSVPVDEEVENRKFTKIECVRDDIAVGSSFNLWLQAQSALGIADNLASLRNRSMGPRPVTMSQQQSTRFIIVHDTRTLNRAVNTPFTVLCPLD